MSRSARKHPIDLSARYSDRWGKQQWHGRLRVRNRVLLASASELDDIQTAHAREVSSRYTLIKGSKRRLTPVRAVQLATMRAANRGSQDLHEHRCLVTRFLARERGK